jgi:transcriptional regulator with AAA-type ATPase domain
MLRSRPSEFDDYSPVPPAPDRKVADQAADAGPLGPPSRIRVADGRTPLLVPAATRARTPREALVLRTSSGETRAITRPTRIGSAPDNDWILTDPYVSQHHALLSPDGDCLRIADRGSRNGTYLNGARVQQGELLLGGCLQIGRLQLRLCAGDKPVLLLGDSSAMATVREQVQRFAPTGLPVLILGESGTGKELVARSLHEQSGRRGELIAVNCGALARDLIESELFGHERGAFTGAQRRHLGCFGEADGGTLFLDEIAELPLELQPRLLRALESRAIRPVGGSRELPVDVRIVAATHRDLATAVARGTFRADLYYRLCGLEIVTPPLRQRTADIPLLVRHFLGELAGHVPPCAISDRELAIVARQPWPGNVRQLRHAVLRAAHLATGPQLGAGDLLGRAVVVAAPEEGVQLRGRRFADLEREIYATALAQTGGNCRAAAELLKVPKSTLHDKLRRLGISLRRDGVPEPPLGPALP